MIFLRQVIALGCWLSVSVAQVPWNNSILSFNTQCPNTSFVANPYQNGYFQCLSVCAKIKCNKTSFDYNELNCTLYGGRADLIQKIENTNIKVKYVLDSYLGYNQQCSVNESCWQARGLSCIDGTCRCTDSEQLWSYNLNKCLKCEHGGIINLNTLKCYILNNNALNYSIANEYCTSMNSYLIKIDDLNKLNFAIEFLNETFWVGAIRELNNNFNWYDGSIVNSNLYCAGEPNNFGNNENCLTGNTYCNLINDVPCDAQFKSICEYSLA